MKYDYEDLVKNFGSKYRENCNILSKAIKLAKSNEDFESITEELILKAAEEDIKNNHFPIVDRTTIYGSKLIQVFIAIAYVLVDGMKVAGIDPTPQLLYLLKMVVTLASNALPSDIMNKLGGPDQIAPFVTRALPGAIAGKLMRDGEIRAYSITNNLAQALSSTRLKGLVGGDLILPENLTVVHLQGKIPAMFIFFAINDENGITNISIMGFFPPNTLHHDHSSYMHKIIDANTSLDSHPVYPANMPEGCYLTDTADKIADDAFNASINAILYITNNPKDTINTYSNKNALDLESRMLNAQGKKREKLKERLRSMPKNPIKLIGRHYIIDKRLQRDPTVSGEADYHLRVRFIVAGHWRKQACGPGLTERRLMWIQPYWKGPEFAPITRSIGIVK